MQVTMREHKKMRLRVGLEEQRGISLTGLILVLMVLGLAAVLAIKNPPSFLQYPPVPRGISPGQAPGGFAPGAAPPLQQTEPGARGQAPRKGAGG